MSDVHQIEGTHPEPPESYDWAALVDDLEVFGNAKRTKSLPKREELRWGSRAAIGVVVVENDIIDGESTEIPLLNMHSTGGRTIVKEL